MRGVTKNDPAPRGPVAGLSPEPVQGRRARAQASCRSCSRSTSPTGCCSRGRPALTPATFEKWSYRWPRRGEDAASELLRTSADELIELGLNMRENRLTLIKAELDVLVFADMLSEPMSYFLGFSRFAPVQVCFWGNPLTTGRSNIDYFVSADRMEHPHRTLAGAEWSEQVVLFDGQGIWYRRPIIPEGLPILIDGAAVAARQALGLPEGDWPLLLCPQSVFKLHPHFDAVVRRILEATTNARVVFRPGGAAGVDEE